jgi:hypothetical protein
MPERTTARRVGDTLKHAQDTDQYFHMLLSRVTESTRTVTKRPTHTTGQ